MSGRLYRIRPRAMAIDADAYNLETQHRVLAD